MKNLLKFFLNLFKPSEPTYSLGAEEGTPDLRNIELTSFQKPVVLPDNYETGMPSVADQGNIPKCVASGITKLKELYLELKGIYVSLSDDDLYEQCKKQDGMPNIGGTFPVIGAKIACSTGIASVEAYKTRNEETIATSRKKHRLGNYAFVGADYESVCQAIFQNKAIVATFNVDSNWFRGVIIRILKSLGRHLVLLHGFRRGAGIIIGQNSWGVGWIGRVAGILNSNTKAGHFEMRWSDYEGNVFDIMTITDIPPELLEEAKAKDYYFLNTLKKGSKGLEVKELQKRLGLYADGSFGDKTKEAVIQFQKANGLKADGIVGQGTRDVLNKKVSKLDLWCEAIKKHEGWYAGSRSFRNNNPGNIKYIGQISATGKDSGNFCIFPSYEVGYNELRKLLIRACSGESSVYKPEMTLYDFYAKYAPDSDGNNSRKYAEVVATFIGVSPQTKIKELL